MVNILIIIGAAGLVVQAFIGLLFFISSIRENEKRASIFSGLQFSGMLGLLIIYLILYGTGFFRTGIGLALLIAGLIFGALASFILLRRTAANPRALEGSKGLIVGEVKRHDERDIVFARNRTIRPGSEQFIKYYEEHPEHKAYDDKRREKGGPLGHFGTIDRPNEGPNVAATLASLSIPMLLSTPDVVKPKAHFIMKGKKINLGPEEATERVKGYALNIGAKMVGITRINPLWIYSHKGDIHQENWEDWGREIQLDHQYAVVFIEEMSFDMIGSAPHTPTTIESMKNYGQGAYTAIQIASFIANLGYSAAANHLRHYEALMVPLAVDAGLGELGRMGYLITKEYGPRVRIGAVTTDLPLITDKPVDIGVVDFCRVCKKCAVCCPSQSIPLEDHTGGVR